MRGDYIDFISAYCDRWCERCAFTSRCSSYAVEIATAMCEGDFEAGLELAVGAPPAQTEEEQRERDEFLEGLINEEPTEQEMAEFTRANEAREDRIDESPITTVSQKFLLLAREWMDDHYERTAAAAGPALADALEVASRDCFFIHVKLHRALKGRDEAQRGEGFDDDPVQNDWNGSAKVALISIERSTRAWDLIARETHSREAEHVAGELRALRREVEEGFPDAWKFVRPGFDTER